MNNYKQILLCLGACCLVLMLSLGACKGLKKTQGEGEEAGGWKTTLRKARKEAVKFKTLSISGKAKISLAKMGVDALDASYQINILHDSLILIRIRKIIEVARIRISPDSIFVLDKINKALMACDFAPARKFTGLEADFSLLQDMILGNYHQIPKEVKIRDRQENPRVFVGQVAGTEFAYFIDALMNKVVEISAENPKLNQQSTIRYEKFETEGGTSMPKQCTIEVAAPEQVSIEFNHRRVDVNPDKISFRFNVPSSYTQIACF